MQLDTIAKHLVWGNNNEIVHNMCNNMQQYAKELDADARDATAAQNPAAAAQFAQQAAEVRLVVAALTVQLLAAHQHS